MRPLARAGMAGLAIMLALSACARHEDPQLMNVQSNLGSPDEFSILPTKPLEQPSDRTYLPPPTPGGTNRVDPTPQDDAIAALGGNPNATRRGSAGDGALLNHAARNGLDPDIRTELAAEDLEYRRRHNGRVMERAFNVNVYYRSYERMSLDQYAELLRWRRLGIATPSAPPPGLSPDQPQ